MFELLTATKTKLLDYKTLSRKNRPVDEKPGVKLSVEQEHPNSVLDHFDPALKALLYERANGSKSAQASLEGVAEATDAPNLTNVGLKLESIRWHHDLTGYGVSIARGAGMGKGNTVHLTDATMCNWNFTLKEGGTVIARYTIEALSVHSGAVELFHELKSGLFEMTAKAPEIAQQDIEDDDRDDDRPAPVKPAPARKPGAAERAAAAKVKGGKAEPPKGKPTKAKAAVTPEGAWPFPKGAKATSEAPPQGVVVENSRPGTRTARGRDATKAFLAAQKKASEAEADAS